MPADATLQFSGLLRVMFEPPAPSKAGAYFEVTINNIRVKGQQMVYKLPADQPLAIGVTYVDAKGNNAAVDGDVTWDTSDATIVSVAVNETNSMLALITAGNVGMAQITATADADLGQGVRTLITPFDVEVVAGEAVAGTIAPLQATPVKSSK